MSTTVRSPYEEVSSDEEVKTTPILNTRISRRLTEKKTLCKSPPAARNLKAKVSWGNFQLKVEDSADSQKISPKKNPDEGGEITLLDFSDSSEEKQKKHQFRQNYSRKTRKHQFR